MDNNLITGEVLTLVNRKNMTVKGVKEIRSFDESYITLVMNDSEATIEGSDLRIISLIKEKGEIEINGDISAFTFSSGRKRKAGLFR